MTSLSFCALVALTQVVPMVWASGDTDAPLGNAFTYQGRVSKLGIPCTGSADMRFKLYDGAVLLGTITMDGVGANPPEVSCNNGLFNVTLDYGITPYAGDALDLEIDVRFPANVGAYTTLTPRQPLTPAPHAIYAKKAPYSGLIGAPACLPVCLPFVGSASVASPSYVFSVTNTGTGRGLFAAADGSNYALHVQREGGAGGSPNNPAAWVENGGSAYGLIAYGQTGGLGGVCLQDGGFGVVGQISSGANGVAVRATNSVSGLAANLGTDTYAGNFFGDVLVSGMISKRYTSTTDDPAIPIAYGFINTNGTVAAATPNVSCVWNSGSQWYEVTITGESYFFNDYATVVTGVGTSAHITTTDSTGGKLLVLVFDAAGARIQNQFQFATFKPNLANFDSNQLPPKTNPNMTDSEWLASCNVVRVAEPRALKADAEVPQRSVLPDLVAR
jgi:hypothetical protein